MMSQGFKRSSRSSLVNNDKLKEVELYTPAGALIFNHVFQLVQLVLFSAKKINKKEEGPSS